MSPVDGSFIDRIKVRLKAGDGGNGIVSFRREKYVPFGGPDGGDGGDGGSILFHVNGGLNTLEKLNSQPFYKADNGNHGGKNNRTGANGQDIILDVPPGTVVINEQSGETIADLDQIGEEIIIAHGGKGGKGNTRFATPTNQAPRKATAGTPGEEFTALIELKLVAHIGLIGLPNAGKSTLISALTGARPRIANYPFTTLHPILGTLHLRDGSSLVMADIPGIIQGAHEGIGLGLEFLRHIERTKMLVYVIEVSLYDPSLPSQTLKDLQHEIRQYDPAILARPYFIVLNKADLLNDDQERQLMLDLFHEELPDVPPDSVFLVSALHKDHIDEVKTQIIHQYQTKISHSSKVEDSNSSDSELHSLV